MHRSLLVLAALGIGCTSTEADSASDTEGDSTGTSETEASSTPATQTGTETTDSTSSGEPPSGTGATDATETTGTGGSSGTTGTSETDGTSSTDSGGEVLDCAMLDTAGGPVEIGASDTPTRIHPYIAFDGEGVWFAYAEVEPAGSLFDIAMMRIRCDGSTWIDAQTVSTNAGNDIDPSISIVGDEARVVWTSDDGTGGTSNLQIFHSAISPDGRITEEASRLSTAFEGVPITQNHTAAATSPRGSDWMIAGVRAHPETATFQAFVQTLDGAAENVGAAWDGLELDTSHLGVAVTASTSGNATVAHTRATDDDEDVILTDLGTKFGDPTAGVEAFPSFAMTSAPSVATDPSMNGAGFVAAYADVGGELDIVVAHYSAQFVVSDPVRFGLAGRLEHNPMLSVDPDGTAGLVFHRNVGGLNNEVVFVDLAFSEAEGISVGDEQVLADESPPYPPTLTALGERRWMVAWAQGSSPLFTTWAQVVEPAR